MTEFQILLTIMLTGHGLTLSLMLVLWNRIDKIDEKLTDVDRRVCRIEGSLSSRGFCLLKDEIFLKKTESV